jgi:hypothetical protein
MDIKHLVARVDLASQAPPPIRTACTALDTAVRDLVADAKLVA